MKRQNLRTVSLIVVTFTYLLIGAAIFGYLESEHEVRQREQVDWMERRVRWKYNITDDDYTVLTTAIIKSVPHKAGIQWKFPGAFYFATTVVTTIGYGHSTPSTMAGRSFCMVYALIGIPLGLVMFQSIGERLNTFVGTALRHAKRCFKTKNPEVTQTNLVMVVLVLSTILMTSMAAIFAKYERWEYFDALYYCFITLTTIGFGDYVALQKESALQSKPEYVALSLIFILFGLSVVSSAVNLLVLKFLTLNTEDERRDEQIRSTAALDPFELKGVEITMNANKQQLAAAAATANSARSQRDQAASFALVRSPRGYSPSDSDGGQDDGEHSICRKRLVVRSASSASSSSSQPCCDADGQRRMDELDEGPAHAGNNNASHHQHHGEHPEVGRRRHHHHLKCPDAWRASDRKQMRPFARRPFAGPARDGSRNLNGREYFDELDGGQSWHSILGSERGRQHEREDLDDELVPFRGLGERREHCCCHREHYRPTGPAWHQQVTTFKQQPRRRPAASQSHQNFQAQARNGQELRDEIRAARPSARCRHNNNNNNTRNLLMSLERNERAPIGSMQMNAAPATSQLGAHCVGERYLTRSSSIKTSEMSPCDRHLRHSSQLEPAAVRVGRLALRDYELDGCGGGERGEEARWWRHKSRQNETMRSLSSARLVPLTDSSNIEAGESTPPSGRGGTIKRTPTDSDQSIARYAAGSPDRELAAAATAREETAGDNYANVGIDSRNDQVDCSCSYNSLNRRQRHRPRRPHEPPPPALACDSLPLNPASLQQQTAGWRANRTPNSWSQSSQAVDSGELCNYSDGDGDGEDDGEELTVSQRLAESATQSPAQSVAEFYSRQSTFSGIPALSETSGTGACERQKCVQSALSLVAQPSRNGPDDQRQQQPQQPRHLDKHHQHHHHHSHHNHDQRDQATDYRRQATVRRRHHGRDQLADNSKSTDDLSLKPRVPRLICKCCCQHDECIRYALEQSASHTQVSLAGKLNRDESRNEFHSIPGSSSTDRVEVVGQAESGPRADELRDGPPRPDGVDASAASPPSRPDDD